jgi:hypothetical protein
MDVSELIARESIRDLVTRYNTNGDSGRFEQVLELFASDAVMELDGPDGPDFYRGHEEILTIFTGTKSRWAYELGGDAPTASAPYIRHRVATHQIDVDDASHARGYCYYQVVMPHGLDHWGRYFDRYECRDGRWVFVHRKVTSEGHVERG